MRKISIPLAHSAFDARIGNLQSFFSTVWKTLPSHPVSNFNLLAEVVFQSGYVSFEGFLSDLFIAYINHDARPFLLHREAAMRNELSPKYARYLSRLSFRVEKNVSVSDILQYVDPEGRNITFKTTKDMVKRAKAWLPAAAGTKFQQLSSQQVKLIDAARAIRNCVAHKSSGSYERMNTALASLPATGVCAALRRSGNSVSSVGVYLRAGANNQTRCEVILGELRSIAKALI